MRYFDLEHPEISQARLTGRCRPRAAQGLCACCGGALSPCDELFEEDDELFCSRCFERLENEKAAT